MNRRIRLWNEGTGNPMFISKEISRLAEDGRSLYIDMRPRVDVCLKYAPWEDGLAMERYNGDGWEMENSDPNLPLITPEHESDPGLPVRAFIESIPADVRAAAARFDHLQTKMLQALAAGEPALDLLHDIPLLLWLAADWAQAPDVSFEDVKALLKKKRVAMLSQMFGRPCSGVDVRFLKKIKIGSGGFNHRQFHFIKHYIAGGRAAEFRHWPEVPYDALVILKNHRDLPSCRFVRLLAAGDYKAMAAIVPNRTALITLISDTMLMGGNLGVTNPMGFINRCETLADLQALHNKWVRKFNERENEREMILRFKKIFPEPPIPGNLKIQPIRNEGELLLEGRLMHHCVGGYSSKIYNGQSYIYRVLKPQRATLEIRGSGMSVHMGQFKLTHNQAPSEEARIEVMRWMEAFKKTLGTSVSEEAPNKEQHPAQQPAAQVPATERPARRSISQRLRFFMDRPDFPDYYDIPPPGPPPIRA
jgi:hypothetical protein